MIIDSLPFFSLAQARPVEGVGVPGKADSTVHLGLLVKLGILDVFADRVIGDCKFHAELQFPVDEWLAVKLAEDEPIPFIGTIHLDPHALHFTGCFILEHSLCEITWIDWASQRHHVLVHYSIGL